MRIIFLFIGLLVLAVACVSKTTNHNDIKTERLVYFRFDLHNSMAQGVENYKVSTLDDGRVHVVIDEGSPDGKELYLGDSTILDELQEMVQSFKMDRYKEQYRRRTRIVDGDAWNLNYRYNTGRSVSSGGYMAWPKNFQAVREAMAAYFQKWRDCQTGVLFIDYFKFTSHNGQGRDIEYTLQRGETETTVTLHDAERGWNKTLAVGNDGMEDFERMARVVRLSDKSYDYVTDDPDVTRCTYFIRYNTGDTVSGVTCYTQYPGQKEAAIADFFNRWMRPEQ